MNLTGKAAFFGSVLVFGGLGALLYWLSSPPATVSSGKPIVILCAAALRTPVEAIKAKFEAETGQPVEISFGSSQAILLQAQKERGDLFLPADEKFIDLAKNQKLIRETMPLATMSAVVVANIDAPPIEKWADLFDPSRQIILADSESTAIGIVTKKSLTKSGLWQKLEAAKTANKLDIDQVCADVSVNPRGVGIVFDSVAAQFPKLRAYRLPELDDVRAKAVVAVTASSEQPAAALRFARYLTARDRGAEVFAKLGYKTPEIADDFGETKDAVGRVMPPEIRLFGGTMLRPAIEDTIKEFADREGVSISTHFQGCGILVGEMLTNKIPDIYFACEPRFLDKVQHLFGERDLVSSNRLVIGVEKGNPKEIRSLKDLGREGMQVGVGNENQCALGDLTKQTFIRTGLYGRVAKNIAKEAPSGDMLISDFRAKALNVIVCYESNVMPFLSEMDYVPVDIGSDNKDCTNPLQPVAIAKASKHPLLSRRLLDAFQTPESKAKFEKLGFGWVTAPK